MWRHWTHNVNSVEQAGDLIIKEKMYAWMPASCMHFCRGLKARPKKCRFGMTECDYLGYTVGRGRVKPNELKLEAIKQFKTPKSKKDVRAFIGLTGYYRRFIPNFAAKAARLSDTTKKNSPNRVRWTDHLEEDFQSLKQALLCEPILKCPDFAKHFYLQTDASERGIGAVLSQKDDDGLEHPIAYFSRKLLPREQKYATVEKECLGIVSALRHFSVYLLGRSFTIQTDHRALCFLHKMKTANGRLTRWSLAIQPFQFEIEHKPGQLNGNADGLSRQAWESDIDLDGDIHLKDELYSKTEGGEC